MSHTSEYGLQIDEHGYILEVYQQQFPNIAYASGSNLRRIILVEDAAATEAAIEYRRGTKDPITAGAGLVHASLVFLVLTKRRVQDCVLGKLRYGDELSVDLVAHCLQKGVLWDDFNFPDFINYVNELRNRKSKEDANRLKEAQKHAKKLESVFSEMPRKNPAYQVVRGIETALEKLPRPKHMTKPKAVLAQALWPILKDFDMTIRPAAKLLRDSMRGLHGPDSLDSNSEIESFRQAIIRVDKLLR